LALFELFALLFAKLFESIIVGAIAHTNWFSCRPKNGFGAVDNREKRLSMFKVEPPASRNERNE